MVNKLIKGIKPTSTFAMKAKVNELRAAGQQVISFGIGEPDIDTPQHIKDAALSAMQQGKTKYTEVPGIPELRTELAAMLTRKYGLNGTAENIIVTNGGKQAIFSLLSVVLEPGDEVVIISPYWLSYPDMITLTGGRTVIVEGRRENQYKAQPEDLERALSSRTKVVIINSPSNPAGVCYSRDELRAIGAVLAKSSALILSDEVYLDLTFNGFKGESFAAVCPELASRIVTIQSFSKTYAMAGWRVGLAHGSKEIINAMGLHQGQVSSNICSIAQYAALAAVRGGEAFLEPVKANYARRLHYAFKELTTKTPLEIPVLPQGAFYLFIGIDRLIGMEVQGKVLANSDDVTMFFLSQAKVATIAGAPFGDDRAIRISVAVSDSELEQGIAAIVTATCTLLDR